MKTADYIGTSMVFESLEFDTLFRFNLFTLRPLVLPFFHAPKPKHKMNGGLFVVAGALSCQSRNFWPK